MRGLVAVIGIVGGCRLNFDPAEFESCEYLDVAATRTFRWSENDHCYSFHASAQSFGLARDACESYGAHLVTFTTRAEHEAVLASLAPDLVSWIGWDTAIGVGWLTGEPSAYSQWAPNFPAYGHSVQQPDGLWATADPGSPLGVVCESSVVVTSDRVYILDHRRDNYALAEARCVARGGHMATITSAAEQLVVEPLLGNSRWLGATDTASEGTFSWITGEPFAFSSFGANEPSGGTSENCLQVSRSSWGDAPCADQIPHLCELQ